MNQTSEKYWIFTSFFQFLWNLMKLEGSLAKILLISLSFCEYVPSSAIANILLRYGGNI
jgi:hypothetical protein